MSQSKRKFLNLQEKAEIIELLQHGAAPVHLSRKYGVAKSTITSIKNKRHNILKSIGSTFNGPGKRKTLKRSVFPKMEEALYKWFLTQKEKDEPINGDMIKEEAKTLHGKFYTDSFHASNGWLQKFKKRYGIRSLQMAGEKLSSQPELIANNKPEIMNTLKPMSVWDRNEDCQPEKEQNEEVKIEDEGNDVAANPIVTDMTISTGEALKSLYTVIQWAKENLNKLGDSSVVTLQGLSAKLMQIMHTNPTKQTSIQSSSPEPCTSSEHQATPSAAANYTASSSLASQYSNLLNDPTIDELSIDQTQLIITLNQLDTAYNSHVTQNFPEDSASTATYQTKNFSCDSDLDLFFHDIVKIAKTLSPLDQAILQKDVANFAFDMKIQQLSRL